jgi:hypothetical protein
MNKTKISMQIRRILILLAHQPYLPVGAVPDLLRNFKRARGVAKGAAVSPQTRLSQRRHHETTLTKIKRVFHLLHKYGIV